MNAVIPGSEIFSSRPISPEDLRAKLPETLKVHTVTQEQIDALDPLTYEVIRHRIWSVTDEMGESLKRMSGSPIVTDANDFDFAISDEFGQEVLVGLYNTGLVGAVDLAIYWTMQHRSHNPGIAEGDMFLNNDPWVGGGLHQNDAIVFQPVFYNGELFAWTSGICHEPDLGGVGLGSFSPGAQDVFSESVPMPPVKVVRDGVIQQDIADMWVRRSRVPQLVELDLHAQVGANNVGRTRLLEIIERYGPDTVKAVMKRMMNDAENRLKEKLSELPDGTWRASGYQDQSHEGDRGLHKITVAMTKTGDRLSFDFTGTDPSAGVINCTYAGMRGGIMIALLPILAHDIPWSAGGLMRCFDIVSDEGTLNNAQFPAAVSRGPIGPSWQTGTLVAECLSQMLDQTADIGKSVQAACCGTWDTAVIAGLDQRGEVPVPFLNILMEPMAGGYGARPDADGMDTGGLFCIPMGRIPDTEMSEFLYPMLVLWRREEPDSGGPGRQRGGVSASMAMTPYGTQVPMGLVLASAGKAVAQNTGLSGGYPGNTGLELIARGSNVLDALATGAIPTTMEEVGGELEIGQNYATLGVNPGEVLFMHWQGGGGYGDPLLRDVAAIQRDIDAEKITTEGASASYGAVIVDGRVDAAATERRRAEIRAERQRLGGGSAPVERVELAGARHINDSLVQVGSGAGAKVACSQCGGVVAEVGRDELLRLQRIDADPKAAGPQITADASDYVDGEIVFRQYCCPGCWTSSWSGLVPSDHPDYALELAVLQV